MVFPTSVCESTIVSAPEAALEDLLWKWCRCLDGRGPGSTGCARELVLTGAAGMELVVVHLLSHVWLFATPWSVSHQAPLTMGFSWEEYWSGLVAISFSRGSSQPRDRTRVSYISCTADRFFTAKPPGIALCKYFLFLKVTALTTGLCPSCATFHPISNTFM